MCMTIDTYGVTKFVCIHMAAAFDCSISIAEAGKKILKMEVDRSKVWDCDSCLYDSFELKSFKRQLDSAIASRSLSMPRFSREVPLPPPPVTLSRSTSSRRISRKFHRILRSVFRLKPELVSASTGGERPVDVHYFMHQSTGGVLPTIPERWEQGGDLSSISPEFDSRVIRKTVSERFTGRIAGISCA